MRTDVFRSVTNGADFAGIFAGSNAGRAVSAAGRDRDSVDFASRSLSSPNPFLAPRAELRMKDRDESASIKSTNQASCIGETTQQERRATASTFHPVAIVPKALQDFVPIQCDGLLNFRADTDLGSTRDNRLAYPSEKEDRKPRRFPLDRGFLRPRQDGRGTKPARAILNCAPNALYQGQPTSRKNASQEQYGHGRAPR
jgi:hypothetical protein